MENNEGKWSTIEYIQRMREKNMNKMMKEDEHTKEQRSNKWKEENLITHS